MNTLKLKTKSTDSLPTAPLTQANQALESSRDAGFDLSAAAGEIVDNSWEAKANHVRIKTLRDKSGSVTDMGFADDGHGIPADLLAAVLSLGYSSRYGSRSGLGRFGMGLKLASLSQSTRIEIYTRTRDDAQIYRTYLDLVEVREGRQTELRVELVANWPEDFAELMSDPASGEPFEAGTLVIWRNIDRLQQGGRFNSSVEERVQELKKFLARAYRRFIDKGFRIELDRAEITLHDPLFLLENPRVVKRFNKNLTASIIDGAEFQIDGHKVRWTVTLLPEQLRKEQGKGGRAGKGREEFADLYIPDNESRVSILRNGREIYYDLVPKLYPGGRDKVDRYIGVEIEFPATLDEYFQVRNVKRGAEPVNKLREELRKSLKKPINTARKDIRDYWQEVLQQERNETGDHHNEAHDAVDDFDQTAPGGRANPDATPNDVLEAIREIIEDMGLDPDDAESVQKAEWVRSSLEARSATIVDGAWPGKEMLDIRHLNGKAIVRVNRRHPFFKELVEPLQAIADGDPDDLDPTETITLLKKLSTGIDLLMIAYARAENMHLDPDRAYGDLRNHWGTFTAGLVNEQLRRIS
jgi:Histidine kinase-, DNA gyrase B-, and HSP90-like ATPase